MPLAADLTCTACHNNTTELTGKAANWSVSLHGSGTAFAAEGTEDGCAGCHSGSAFSAMLAAGLTPDKSLGDPNPTPQDCRACHQIHTTYTLDDYALTTTSAVAMYATGTTFDGGEGNLCANCHQARRLIPAVKDGQIAVTARFGPHHGPQSDMLIGVGGAGAVTGTPSAHYTTVENTCVTCHMGDARNHTFAPNLATCLTCHPDAKDFDINGVRTTVTDKLNTLAAELKAAGMITEGVNAEGETTYSPVAGSFDEAKANALWNFIYIVNEDKSLGVHNSKYTIALLDASLAVFGK
jgi:hypothetical protein